MSIAPEVRDAILKQCSHKSVRQLARVFGLSRDEVTQIISEASGVKTTELAGPFFFISRKIQNFTALVFLMVAGFFVYAGSLNNEFVWDDRVLIPQDSKLADWANLKAELTSPLGRLAGATFDTYRPMQTLSFMIDRHLWGLNPAGFRIVNVFFHILAAFLVFLFLKIILKNTLVPFLTALFFVIHPANTSAVEYISARDNPLFLCFALSALIGYVAASEKGGKAGKVFYLFSVLAALGALMTREIMPLLLAVFLSYEVIFKKNTRPVLWIKSLWPYLAVSAAYYFLCYRPATRLSMDFGAHFQQADLTLKNAWLLLSPVLMIYLRLFLFPVGLHQDYIFSRPHSLGDSWIFPNFLMLFVVVAAAIYLSRKSKIYLFGFGWFVIWFLPYSNVFGFLNATMAEHWMYVSYIGLFLVVSMVLVQWMAKPTLRKPVMALAIGMVVFWGALSVRQHRYWANEEALFLNTIRYNPESARALENLGFYYRRNGQEDKARDCLAKAHELRPDLI
jgi:protein O-mannosyl-transferase